jgi:hypothetical protein
MFAFYFKMFDVSGQGCKNPQWDHFWKIIGGNILAV